MIPNLCTKTCILFVHLHVMWHLLTSVFLNDWNIATNIRGTSSNYFSTKEFGWRYKSCGVIQRDDKDEEDDLWEWMGDAFQFRDPIISSFD